MRCFGCLGAILAALAVFEWSIKGRKPAIESLSCCREQTVFPPYPNIASWYLEPDPLYPTRSFSEQNPEWFKSASSRNHPRLSEASCLPKQAVFEASCFQQHSQEKRERIWPLYQFFVVFSSGYRLFWSVHVRVRAVYQFELDFQQYYFLRSSNSSSINLQPSGSLCSAETKGSRLTCPASVFKTNTAGFGRM